MIVLAALGWAAVLGLALFILSGDSPHQIGRAEVEVALDKSVEQGQRLISLIRAARAETETARRLAARPGLDTDGCLDALFALAETGALSESAIASALDQGGPVVAGEIVEVR